jgi:hypothetical protein
VTLLRGELDSLSEVEFPKITEKRCKTKAKGTSCLKASSFKPVESVLGNGWFSEEPVHRRKEEGRHILFRGYILHPT